MLSQKTSYALLHLAVIVVAAYTVITQHGLVISAVLGAFEPVCSLVALAWCFVRRGKSFWPLCLQLLQVFGCPCFPA